ncbi:hypothetical protein OSB04_021607 [Centaurea solstitialis]|uniref:Cullin N-terminal domain-containing protein n=1 Tax=Centaurea solstitialis TaxID=347529 RepID=A0AA38WGE5_9ASTR|nr:hypothetical protein OSB04_021607 [Centaurea solstitialis]
MSSNQKKRNFQIEAFKHKVVVDPRYADKTWRLLEHAINEIYNHNASGLSFEELYRSLFFLHFPILSYDLQVTWISAMSRIATEYLFTINSHAYEEVFGDLGLEGFHIYLRKLSLSYVALTTDLQKLIINAYNMVLHKFGEKLYTGLVSTMTSHLTAMSGCIENAHGEMFLEELNNKWTDHNKALQMIRDILMYMDRTYVPSSRKTPVHELGLNLWRDNVIHLSGIQTRLQNTLLQLIHRERTGEVINRGLMRNIIKMLMDLGPSVYQVDFERLFLEVSADFYRVESQEFIECCDCGDYLQKAERRLNEEIDRVSHYLDTKSEIKITML